MDKERVVGALLTIIAIVTLAYCAGPCDGSSLGAVGGDETIYRRVHAQFHATRDIEGMGRAMPRLQLRAHGASRRETGDSGICEPTWRRVLGNAGPNCLWTGAYGFDVPLAQSDRKIIFTLYEFQFYWNRLASVRVPLDATLYSGRRVFLSRFGSLDVRLELP